MPCRVVRRVFVRSCVSILGLAGSQVPPWSPAEGYIALLGLTGGQAPLCAHAEGCGDLLGLGTLHGLVAGKVTQRSSFEGLSAS